MAKPRLPVELSAEALSSALRDVDGRARLILSVKPKATKEGLAVGPDGGVLLRLRTLPRAPADPKVGACPSLPRFLR